MTDVELRSNRPAQTGPTGLIFSASMAAYHPCVLASVPAAHYPGGSRRCACRLLPHTCGLPQMTGGSASALELSRPARASLCYGPSDRSAAQAAFVAGLRPSPLPGRAACQLPDQSTIIRVKPSSLVVRALGAHGQSRHFGRWPTTSEHAPGVNVTTGPHVSKVPSVTEVANLIRSLSASAYSIGTARRLIEPFDRLQFLVSLCSMRAGEPLNTFVVAVQNRYTIDLSFSL